MTGLRFALEPGSGRDTVPVRSAIVGTVFAGPILTATFTFGTSLTNLVPHPRLYGWNWNYEMVSAYSGAEDLPGPQLASLLDHDPHVAAWSGINFVSIDLDGVSVPALATNPKPAVAPPLLSGHGLEQSNQVVLGAATLRQLHKSVGDTVLVDSRTGASHALTVVGTATMPTIGSGGGSHFEMGTGLTRRCSRRTPSICKGISSPGQCRYSCESAAAPTPRPCWLPCTGSTTTSMPSLPPKIRPAGWWRCCARPRSSIRLRRQTPGRPRAGPALGAVVALRHLGGIGPAAPAGPGSPQVPGTDRAPAGRHRTVAVDVRRVRRDGGGYPARRGGGPDPLGPVRPGDQRRGRPERARRGGDSHRRRGAGTGQRGGGVPGSDRGPHTHGPDAPGRVAGGPARCGRVSRPAEFVEQQHQPRGVPRPR